MSMRRFLTSGLILIVSFAAAFWVWTTWRGMRAYLNPLSREALEEAIRLVPSYPDPYYRLALYHGWELREIDLQRSLYFLKKAIDRNPLEQQYWIQLSRLYLRMGKEESAQWALERAIQVFPTGYQGRWLAGNLLLQLGQVEEAIPHFSYILTHYPNQGYLVYEVLGRVLQDSGTLFERVVPKDPHAIHRYLVHLYEQGDKKGARYVWQRRLLLGHQVSREETLQHIDFLLREEEVGEAFRIWRERLRSEGLPLPPEGELITNGGFENEGLLGAGFDWRMGKVAGAEVSIDPSQAYDGRRSLKIEFNGKENVDFHHVSQIVPLKPNTDYELRARIKARGVTTKSGLKLEILGIGASFYQASDSITGDQDWREVVLSFRTPAQLKGGVVRFRREKTEKFDRFISGTLWADGVSLKEKR